MEEKLIPKDIPLDFAKRLWRRAYQPTPFPPGVAQIIVGGWDNGIWRSLNVGLVHKVCHELLKEK